MQFANQVVIVTGGTRGIGRGITEAFLNEGATVYATYAHNDQAAESFKSELGELSSHLHLAKFNVASEKECEAFFEKVMGHNDEIHVLVNNSGVRQDNLAVAMTEEEWDKVLDINLKGTYLMSKHAIMAMMKKRYGRIINISSIGEKLGLPGQANYAASKAGQIAYSKSVSKEVAKRKITINNVCPGFIETELISDLDEKLVKEYKDQVPMKRFGSVREVAHAVLFLAHKNASYITGASLDISGGL
ncbi:MAG: beta-ketoacyl-ACP reductase [Halobacteriovoraceae bacterium]|nr:beta-ketoacyl-ACP reductase [Halobacteriovoraceae bacterium]|tara:strand:+ start:8473 stop:9210 length:738 start_codon:yes stop_codon:yes gene_type:complete